MTFKLGSFGSEERMVEEKNWAGEGSPNFTWSMFSGGDGDWSCRLQQEWTPNGTIQQRSSSR